MFKWEDKVESLTIAEQLAMLQQQMAMLQQQMAEVRKQLGLSGIAAANRPIWIVAAKHRNSKRAKYFLANGVWVEDVAIADEFKSVTEALAAAKSAPKISDNHRAYEIEV